jgi:glycosyltransferase involved in cell wall biosynthesis
MTCPVGLTFSRQDLKTMKSAEYYRNEARFCRRDALGLALFAAACGLALLLMGEPTPEWDWVPLALWCGLLVGAAGASNEAALARRMERLADHEETYQPLERI